VAKGDDCDDFPPPQEPFQPTPFYGKYQSGSGGDTGSSYTEPSTSGTTDYSDGGYDQQYYEAPPQPAPPVQAPPPPTPTPPVTPTPPQVPEVPSPAVPVPSPGGVGAPGQ
jgi:hypothetical protein